MGVVTRDSLDDVSRQAREHSLKEFLHFLPHLLGHRALVAGHEEVVQIGVGQVFQLLPNMRLAPL